MNPYCSDDGRGQMVLSLSNSHVAGAVAVSTLNIPKAIGWKYCKLCPCEVLCNHIFMRNFSPVHFCWQNTVGFGPNDRGVSVSFGVDTVNQFLKLHDFDLFLGRRV